MERLFNHMKLHLFGSKASFELEGYWMLSEMFYEQKLQEQLGHLSSYMFLLYLPKGFCFYVLYKNQNSENSLVFKITDNKIQKVR
jgi:hypothetical protein